MDYKTHCIAAVNLLTCTYISTYVHISLLYRGVRTQIDSVLSARSEGENDASRRLKTEFLVQVDGVGRGNGGTESDNSGGREHLLILAATNVPQAGAGSLFTAEKSEERRA